MILGIISKESIYSQSKVGIISKYLLGIMPANENTGTRPKLTPVLEIGS